MDNDNEKKKSKKRTNKKYIVIAILLLIIGISIGYATLSATLNITGNTKIEKASWDIHFENLVVTSGSVDATTPATVDGKKTSINYAIDLERMGDFYEFKVDIKNAGTIPAKVSTQPILSGVDRSQQSYIDYQVTYLDGTQIKTDDYLDVGAKRTIKVRVQYRTDIDDASQLPATTQDLKLTFAMNYIQG